MKTFRHILVPIDHEPHSREALEYAVTIATRFGAEIAIVHADRDDGALAGETTVVLFPPDRVSMLADKLQTHHGAALHAFLPELEDLGIPQRQVNVDTTDLAGSIVDVARGADLIVIGSHGRTGAPRLFRGSVAEVVARTAPCPVMIVHAPTERDRS